MARVKFRPGKTPADLGIAIAKASVTGSAEASAFDQNPKQYLSAILNFGNVSVQGHRDSANLMHVVVPHFQNPADQTDGLYMTEIGMGVISGCGK